MTLPLRVTVAPERADAAPGDHLTFDVSVRNASDIVEHYGVELLGLPEGATVRSEPDVAKLRPSEEGTLTVRVGLPVAPPAPAGTYVVGALVRSRYRQDVSRCVEVPVELAAVERIAVQATPEVVTGGRTGQFTVEVSNGGNAPVRLALTATDPERRVDADFRPSSVDLPPGTSARALLTVRAPLPWNREKHRQLSIAATPDLPGAAAGSGTASFVQRPRFASKFAKVAGIGAAVLVLAAAVAVPTLLAGRDKEKDPGRTGAVVTPTPPSTAPASAAGTSVAAPPPAASQVVPPPASSGSAPVPSAAPPFRPPVHGGAATRDVDLTGPKDGVVASDAFRANGFLISADPGAVAVPGCEDARAAAVVTDPDGVRFLTSSTADDPAACHTVPLMLDFFADAPAGAITVTPVDPDALEMDVVYLDLGREIRQKLTVPAATAAAHRGIDRIVIRPRAADGAATAPVALKAIRVAPLSG